ncbi:MAG: serine/threonine protein kinase [Candidatus Omnitrophica bacterium]|nr:serine/threonine protein kinase [Candidatus Omnitrophota bacterium]
MNEFPNVQASSRSGWSETKENLYRFRDRLAYNISLKKDLGKKLVLAFAFGFSLFLVGHGLQTPVRDTGSYTGWRTQVFLQPGIVGFVCALVTMILGSIKQWWGVFYYLLSFEILVGVYLPEIFWVASGLAIFTFFLWFNIRPHSGALAALFLIPALESHLGLIALAPLGFACFYSKGKSIWLTFIVFLWVEALGIYRDSVSRFIEMGVNVFPHSLPLSYEQVTHPFTGLMLRANREVAAHLLTLSVENLLLVSWFLKLALAFLSIWVIRTNYTPIRFQDRLALEYLSKKGQKVAHDDLILVKAPLSILGGLGIWVIGQGLLLIPFPHLYTPLLFAGDLLAAAVIIPMVLLDYHGDPTMPHEFSHQASGASGLEIRKSPSQMGSSLRTPTPSELRVQYAKPSPSSMGGFKKDPTQLRLRTWKDRVDLDWEGTLPDGSKIRLGRQEETRQPPPSTALPPTRAKDRGFEVGKKIDGQYRVEKILTGGMGLVYIVMDEFSETRFAVKTLRDDFRNNGEAVQRFTAEAKTWIRLGSQGPHPNMVQALYYREIDNRPLLFLEYVEGTTLEEIYSREGPRPSYAKLVEWGIQVCDGMQFASTKELADGTVGLVHRDLKPANIMINKEGNVKITDFGLAKVAATPTNLTKDRVGMGTLKYMAPEQVKDAKRVDPRADIYSLGAILYEGVAGHPPFTEEDSVNLYMAVLSKEPAPLGRIRRDIPSELDHIIMRCLNKDRDQRYSSFEEAGWALKRFYNRLLDQGDGRTHLRVVS